MLARPMRPKEIAAELGLSVKTVEGYLAQAKDKIGASSTVHAARLYGAALVSAPGNFLADFPRVEALAVPEPTDPGPIVGPAMTQGRQIKLGWYARTGIIAGMTFALILSVLVLVAGAYAITLLAGDYNKTISVNH